MSEVVATLLALGALAATHAEPAKVAELRYVGTPAVAAFVADAMSHYDGPQLRLTLNEGQSAGCLWEGTCQLAVVAGPVQARLVERGAVATWLAKEALVVVNHPSNPVRDLGADEVAAIATGRITRWSELGGHDRPIRLIGAKEPSGDVGCDEVMARLVAADPDAVALIGAGALAAAPPLQVIAVDDQRPVVGDDDYALRRDLFLVTKGAPAAALAEFVAWTQSDDGQQVVEGWFLGLR